MLPTVEAYCAERMDLAGRRFAEFCAELRGAFVERETLLDQIALSLLSREHVLITGPPGTAKSKLASSILGRILDETTGEPSLFSRQFTESTVQTDLVGPINFKTLMETGRTEHFTDEGMLGAVHAFLDEVFDGRDMLLRSTLNVLHERELKQGTTVTRGEIECAVMTSNRYLSEILGSSRETLLAFVDRIAFLSFVPKGFAAPESLVKVLRTEVAGTKPRPLGATLTIGSRRRPGRGACHERRPIRASGAPRQLDAGVARGRRRRARSGRIRKGMAESGEPNRGFLGRAVGRL